MTRLELVEQVAKRSGVSQQMADKVLVAALESIIESVCSDKVVTLIGFGTFRAVDRAERVGRNPVTGEQIKIPAQRLPKFIPGTAFKEALRDDSVRQALEQNK